MHFARGLFERRKQGGRQRAQFRLLDLQEESADLLANRAVQARVGDGAFPVGEKNILGREAGKLAALEGVRLGVFYAGLDLALVARHRRLRGQKRGAVMVTESAQLRVELG